MDKRIESGPDVIDASHIVVKNGSFPIRIVLRKLEEEGKYVVHEELLKTVTPSDGSACKFVHHGFHQGSYFDYRKSAEQTYLPTEEEARKKAESSFINRCRDL